jgi:hypothetical protein
MAAKGGAGGDGGRSDDVIMLFIHVKRGRGGGGEMVLWILGLDF